MNMLAPFIVQQQSLLRGHLWFHEATPVEGCQIKLGLQVAQAAGDLMHHDQMFNAAMFNKLT